MPPLFAAAPQNGDADGFANLIAEVEDFIRGVVTLDPEQAVIRGGLTLLVVLGAALLLWSLRVLLKALVERIAPDVAHAPERKRARIGRWSLRVARLAIAVAAIFAVLNIWGFDYAALRDGPFGAVLAAATRIALIIVIALALIELGQIAVRQTFARIANRARNPRRAAQVRTLAPLITGAISTIAIIMASMIVLSEIGVEIGPLIAGAGIAGIAIGFGAQTLVKDFLTGFFLLLEDVVSIGDVVRIGDASGLVEDMSLRTIKLRAFDGTLQVIPYGEAQIVYNMTKGFSFYVVELSITYDADIAGALDIMKRTGDDLRADPEFGPLMLEPIEMIGVEKLADSAVVLRARLKTFPIKQWTVGREYLKRVKLAFDEGGVEFAFPHVKLVAPADPIMLADRPAR